MWSAPALQTVSTGAVPPLQLAAMTLAVGAGVGALLTQVPRRSGRAATLVIAGAVLALREPWRSRV